MKEQIFDTIRHLDENRIVSDEELKELLTTQNEKAIDELLKRARNKALKQFGNKIFIRGLIEISNYCWNDCFYCGIRHGNEKVERYRLIREEILSCCEQGYQLGFRTFVMQSGEDSYWRGKRMEELVSTIRRKYPDCAITLSLGEMTKEMYQRLYDAGANRYLLRHETAEKSHYEKLHPKELSFEQRRQCLLNLREIGFQVGSGFMVGSPYQKLDYLIRDLRFLWELQPHMIGIGPFLSHKDTPFADKENGSLERTVRLIAILRLMFPKSLIPATTALGTIASDGRERGILAGANVVMPNLSPQKDRKKYMLYDNKIATGEEAAEGLERLKERIKAIGYEIITARGDFVS